MKVLTACLALSWIAAAAARNTPGSQDDWDATCSSTEDPHYTTFDGDTFTMMTDYCEMIMMQNCTDNNGLGFAVFATNVVEPGTEMSKPYRLRLSFTGSYTQNVVIEPTQELYVDNQPVPLASNPTCFPSGSDESNAKFCAIYVNSYIWLYQPGKFQVGQHKQYNRYHKHYLYISSDLKGKVCGVCGNANGNINDDLYQRTEFTSHMRKDRNKGYDGVCDSEQLHILNAKACANSFDEEKAKKECGFIRRDLSCRNQVNLDTKFHDCIQDYCNEPNQLTRCSSLRSLLIACEPNSLTEASKWTNETGCKLHCEDENAEYSAQAPSCPEECDIYDTDGECHELEPQEGCVCKDGYVMDNGKCIPRSECGCILKWKKTYYPLGSFYFQEMGGNPCAEKRQCVKRNDAEGKSGRWDISEDHQCPEHSQCSKGILGKGDRMCVCDEGFRYNNETDKCDDIDECTELNTDCDPNRSSCSNSIGSFECHCLEEKHYVISQETGLCVCEDGFHDSENDTCIPDDEVTSLPDTGEKNDGIYDQEDNYDASSETPASGSTEDNGYVWDYGIGDGSNFPDVAYDRFDDDTGPFTRSAGVVEERDARESLRKALSNL